MKFVKLVRDKVPQILMAEGKKPETHIADDEEYGQRLESKLKEEVQEFLMAGNVDELADIQEVIYALCDFLKFDFKDVETARQKKFEERGGFKKRIVLDDVN